MGFGQQSNPNPIAANLNVVDRGMLNLTGDGSGNSVTNLTVPLNAYDRAIVFFLACSSLSIAPNGVVVDAIVSGNDSDASLYTGVASIDLVQNASIEPLAMPVFGQADGSVNLQLLIFNGGHPGWSGTFSYIVLSGAEPPLSNDPANPLSTQLVDNTGTEQGSDANPLIVEQGLRLGNSLLVGGASTVAIPPAGGNLLTVPPTQACIIHSVSYTTSAAGGVKLTGAGGRFRHSIAAAGDMFVPANGLIYPANSTIVATCTNVAGGQLNYDLITTPTYR